MELLIPFARETATNRVVSPDEVSRGNACGCTCLFCEVPMQARKCKDKRDYFAHQPREVNDDNYCPASFERSVFWMARRILSESRSLELPDYDLTLSDTHFGIYEQTKITTGRCLAYDAVIFPSHQIDIKEDAAILTVGDHQLAVTLAFGVEHRWKAFVHEEVELPHLVINMNAYSLLFQKQASGFREQMTSRLLTSLDGKQWAYHPHQLQFEKEFKLRTAEALEKEQTAAKKMVRYVLGSEPGKKIMAEDTVVSAATKCSNSEQRKQRLDALIAAVRTLYSQGIKCGYRCDDCRFIRKPESDTCTYCGSNAYTPISLTESYLTNIRNIYWQGNYDEISLITLPAPDVDHGT